MLLLPAARGTHFFVSSSLCRHLYLFLPGKTFTLTNSSALNKKSHTCAGKEKRDKLLSLSLERDARKQKAFSTRARSGGSTENNNDDRSLRSFKNKTGGCRFCLFFTRDYFLGFETLFLCFI